MKAHYLKAFLLLFLMFATQVRAADQGDWYSNLYFGWDLNRKLRNSGLVLGIHAWNEVGFGAVFEQSEVFSAPGLDVRWMIEPFEFYLNPQLAYWAIKRGWFGQVSMGFNYLVAMTSTLSAFFAFKGYFPHKEKRSLYLGAGLRYIF